MTVEYIFSNLPNPLATGSRARNARSIASSPSESVNSAPASILPFDVQLCENTESSICLDNIHTTTWDGNDMLPPPEYAEEDPLLTPGMKIGQEEEIAVGECESGAIDFEGNHVTSLQPCLGGSVYRWIKAWMANVFWKLFIVANHTVDGALECVRHLVGYQPAPGVAILVNTETILHRNDDPLVAQNFAGPVSCSYS